MATSQVNCTRCNKRLSRKTARVIDGKVLCSTCMFAGQAFDRAYEAEHPDERAALFAGLEAAEPFIRTALGMKKR